MTKKTTLIILFVLAALGMLVAPMAFAQEDMPDPVTDERPDRPVYERSDEDRVQKSELSAELDAIEEVEVAREIDTLPDAIEPQPDDPNLADTALVFTNMSRRTSWVKCVGFNKNGRPVGRTSTDIPPLGLRYVLASDISNGVDFVGQVQCKPMGRVVGSVVFIGPDLTDLPVRNGRIGKSRIRFPLAAYY